AQAAHLNLVEIPAADLDGVEERPIVLIAFFDVDGLLDTARIDAGEASHGGGEVAGGGGGVGGAARAGAGPGARGGAEARAPAVVAAGEGRVHEAGEGPLAGSLVVGRKGKVAVFVAGEFAEGTLREERGEEDDGSCCCAPDDFPRTHLAVRIPRWARR